jgi:hypothetical protein
VSTSAHTQRAYTPTHPAGPSHDHNRIIARKKNLYNTTGRVFTSLHCSMRTCMINVRSLASNLFSFHIRWRTTLRDSFALCLHSIVTTCSSSSDRCRAVHGLCTCRLVSALSLIDDAEELPLTAWTIHLFLGAPILTFTNHQGF